MQVGCPTTNRDAEGEQILDAKDVFVDLLANDHVRGKQWSNCIDPWSGPVLEDQSLAAKGSLSNPTLEQDGQSEGEVGTAELEAERQMQPIHPQDHRGPVVTNLVTNRCGRAITTGSQRALQEIRAYMINFVNQVVNLADESTWLWCPANSSAIESPGHWTFQHHVGIHWGFQVSKIVYHPHCQELIMIYQSTMAGMCPMKTEYYLLMVKPVQDLWTTCVRPLRLAVWTGTCLRDSIETQVTHGQIPTYKSIVQLTPTPGVKHVLIGLFTELVAHGIDKHPILVPCILLCGKGNPDNATLGLANLLANHQGIQAGQAPTHVFTNSDPFGYRLASLYIDGQKGHELSVRNVIQIGVKPGTGITGGLITTSWRT
ncbi:hypothetical protein PtB15_10B441 [Puccinia triticina]|nr:hypothetical protein PtB15_10B441 [Puccinia triticina]